MKFENLACFAGSRTGRTCVCVLALTISLFVAGIGADASGPAMTTVNDIVYRADGNVAAGKMLISWPAFTTADGKVVAAGSMTLPIGAGGNVLLLLAPNEGATPNGTYYKVVLKLEDGTTETEYWTVPKRSPVKVSEVRSQVVPASVALQMASRQYVDSTLSAKADNAYVLHNTGNEQVDGVKQFIASPLVPAPTEAAAVANKDYVDAQVAGTSTGDFVKKSGDAMSGPLTLMGDPTSTNHAANRHYVDLQVAGVTGSVAQKLGRQGDTPISLAGVRYASQFPSIQAAITDAGTTGTVVIPSDYTGTDAFTNPNNIQIKDMRGDAAGTQGIYNIRDFGAKPGDGLDDWAAIQAAIDAASVGVYGPFGAVYVPKGIYHVSKPLHIYKGIKFYGAGRGVSEITGFTADQGAVMVVSPPVAYYPGLPTGPALATGAGTSMYLDGTFGYELNLRENGAIELNGKTALTVEFYYQPDFTVGAGTYNIVASSGSVTGPDANTAFGVQHVTGDAIQAWLNVGGTQQALTTPTGVLSQGTVAHIAFTYDGAMLRLFVNGVLKASTPTTGGIYQTSGEEITVGPRVGGFLESTFLNYMTKGWVDSLRISNNARYTANFPQPTAKFAYDGSTLFLLNFDNNFGQFTTATTWLGPEHLFLRRFGGGLGQVGNFHLRDMQITGTGPLFVYMINSYIDNISITAARRGLHFVNNCYLNRLGSIRVVGQTSTQFGIGIGPASGVLTMTDINISGGHYPFYLDNSSAVIHGLWVELAAGTEIGAVLKGNVNGSVIIDGPIFSNETDPQTVKYGLVDVGLGSVILNGGAMETSSGAPHVGIFGGGTFVHTGADYNVIGGTMPASIFKIVTPLTNPVRLIGAMQQQSTQVPWADNMAQIQTSDVKTNQSCSGTDKLSGISSTGSLVCTPSLGYMLTLMNTAANSPANGTAYYFGGNLIDTNNTSFDAAKIEVPKPGTIKRIYIRENVPSGNTGSGEMVTHKVCINSSTNCFGSAALAYNTTSGAVSDTTVNQAVNAGDTIAIRVDTPNWTTRPSNARWYAQVYIE
mgnify:CR=1 FL=1